MRGDGDFIEGIAEPDSDETLHIRPAREDKSVNVPVGVQVEVPAGMVAAPNTYVDAAGVLRSKGDGSCVVWHNSGCQRRGIRPNEIEYTDNGAPWCPDCWRANILAALNKQDEDNKKAGKP
jgi:hypothetical protein